MNKIVIHSEKCANSFGKDLALKLKAGDVLALVGDLGTGKTTLTKAIAKGLKIQEEITSPTFTIVKEYNSGVMPLYHFDVYRVHDPDELFNIGIEEYFDGEGICIVEWADLIEDILPAHTKYIYLEYYEEGKRIYTCTF